jgi:23S rRNA (adenine2503-C2)-methyltransferase
VHDYDGQMQSPTYGIQPSPEPDASVDPLAMPALEFSRAANRRWRVQPHDARLAYRALHRSGVAPGAPLEWIAPPAPAKTLVDGMTVKFTLPVGDGLETESVLIPMPHRDGSVTRTLCVSSQVGCAMGCAFCETAQMGLMRQLSVREIVQQLHVARHTVTCPESGRTGMPVKNIVFMGMGEPMDNLDAVLPAIEVLCDHDGPAVPAQNITVSTVGRLDGIRRLGKFISRPGFRKLNLAVSLNAPNDAIRSSIMPINRSAPMAALREALVTFPMRKSAAICVEYVLIPGVNDAPEHADEVCGWLRGIRCSLNVIPYNPRRDSPWRAPTEDETAAFLARCIANGQFTKRRGTKGRAAMAACGQLGNERIRRRRFVPLQLGDSVEPRAS